VEDRVIAFLERHWRRAYWLLLAGSVIYFLSYKWGAIRWLALSDTDDNLRLAQVQAWLHGQGWYDLRQYKLDPPAGANIHWSRIVDLPIAALLLIGEPLFGAYKGQQIATAIAPMLAFAATLWAMIVAVRRLVAPLAYVLAFALLLCAQTALFMWMPLRIDHHGWQLAMLMLAVTGLTDPAQRRGGILVALATAVSLGIGLELLPSMAMAGAAVVLRWVWEREQVDRLRSYAVALGGGCALIFAGFASKDNRALICDAFTPVYLSSMLGVAALLFLIALVPAERRLARFALALGAGAVVAIGFAGLFPQCLGRPEHISPELDKLWFRNIREVKPLYTKPWRDAFDIAALPIVGVIGAVHATWRARRTPLGAPWGTIALLAFFSTAMMFWQSRYAPQAQMLAVLGATAIGWPLMSALMNARNSLLRIAGPTLAFLLVSGLAVEFATEMVPKPAKPAAKGNPNVEPTNKVELANRRCPTLPALGALRDLPAATILTHVDLGPRLIAMTKHSAIAGPYHRNGAAILDIHRAFRATSPEVAHEVMVRHHATLLLVCPGMSETTLYAAQDPQGFYVQLRGGKVPAWLAPVDLPKNSPYKLWRLVG
jgi:hypothetical protein